VSSTAYMNFQKLFREADEYAGIHYYDLPEKTGDTSEFDAMAAESGGRNCPDKENTWWKLIKCYDHDMIFVRNCKAKVYLPPSFNFPEVRRIRYHDSDFSNTAKNREPWENELLFDKRWEDEIQWDYEEESESRESEGGNNQNSIIYFDNKEMIDGSWTKWIVWDDSIVECYDGKLVEDVVPLIIPKSYDRVVLKPQIMDDPHSLPGSGASTNTLNIKSGISTPGSTETSETAPAKSSTSLSTASSSSTKTTNAGQGNAKPIHSIGENNALKINNSNSASANSSNKPLTEKERKEREKFERVMAVKGVTSMEDIAVKVIANSSGYKPVTVDDSLTRRKRYTVPVVDHGLIATSHRNTKGWMSLTQAKSFHRPRLPRKVFPIHVIFPKQLAPIMPPTRIPTTTP